MIKIISGERYGRWTVIEESERIKGDRAVLVRCDCGTQKVVRLKSLKCGSSVSCGCFRSEYIANRNYKHGHTIRNNEKERLYNIWSKMKMRCNNTNDPEYANYGGRGISVCSEWLNDYESFREWSYSNGYDDTLSIDRIDNDKGYSPDNCRWTTMLVQSNNTRVNHLLTYKGETHTLADWGRITGINDNLIGQRLRKGFPLEKVFFCGNLRYYKESEVL